VTETPWEETDQHIRSGHRPEDFEPDSFRTITISEDEGIKAVVGKPKGKETMEVQSYLFDKAKGWTIDKAKAWFDAHKESVVKGRFEAVFPFTVLEKVVDKPLRIRGVAIKAGVSRNLNVYTPEELANFADRLSGAPVYVEHVAVPNAIGKVVKAWWDPKSQTVFYEAEIYDDEVAEKIRKGLIQHVSVGADYETLDVLDGKVPHGLHNAELSLVAVPGIPETNIQVLESLQQGKAKASESLPLKAAALVDDFRLDGREYITPGEYILGFHRDPYAFMPEHFSTVWLDRENGVLALIGRLRQEPEKRRIQAILFQREKWDEPKIRDWFLLHPHYLIESASAPTGSPPQAQAPLKEHGGKMEEQKNAGSNPAKTENEKPGPNPSRVNRVTERVWTRKYINDLPDSAFAVILPSGEKDGEGKTTPRSLRKFPHHTADGKIDLPHLRNANARVPQSDLTLEQKREAMRHLAAHKKALGIGMAAEEAKLVEQEPVGDVAFEVSSEPTLDELIASIEDIVDQINTAIENLDERIQKLEQTQTSKKAEEKSEKPNAESVAEQLLAKPASKDSNLIDKRLILELIPPERVVRSWSYGPRQLVNKIRYVLTQSSQSIMDEPSRTNLEASNKAEKGES
jgi:hypothetical protein